MFSSNTTQVSTGGYQISRSLRFDSASSSYLNRTPASAGNRKTWTWSGWVKRSTLRAGLTDPATIFNAGGNGFLARFSYANQDQLEFYNYSGAAYQLEVITTQVFRDVSAWYHIVFVLDTTQATSSNRFKVYVNGSQITSFSTATYPSQNADLLVNNTSVHAIGVLNGIGGYYNGYMTEINFIDGQALTPSSFGETNAQTGVWQPKAYSGSYGTNGFYVNFSDNSNTTAATLGKDYSGNGNNWTPNNFSVTAGAGNDSLVDSPTSYGTDTGVGGTVRGNYSTFNSLAVAASTPTFSNGNLDLSASAAWNGSVGTIGINSGKWYWETVCGNGDAFVGICGSNAVLTTSNPQNINGTIVYYGGNGEKRIDGTSSSYGASYTTETIGVALDIDGGTVTFYKNNTSQGSISLSSSTLNGLTIFPLFVKYSSTMTVNFGQRPFAYTAPSGFKALCTQNLPTPTIGATSATQAGQYFTPNLWAGNDGLQTVTNNIDTTNGGGLIWFKGRNLAVSHFLVNSGSGYTKFLASNTTAAEDTYNFGFTPSTTGFSFNASSGSVNQSGYNYVAWQWKAGGSGSTNTAGSITSTVSANTTSGFSIVTYTGTGANATVGHGLGVAPSFIIIKRRDDGSSWNCYQANLGASQYIQIDGTAGAATNTGVWNNTAPTSSVFSIGTAFAGVNASGSTHVAYCFAEVAGYSKFGSYTGNGSSDGPFVYTGFRPAYVMVKPSSAAGSWWINDNKRDTYNVNDHRINANTSDAEATAGFTQQDFLSNGFKWRNSDSAWNGSGVTYIYMAFAENPFKYSLAR